MDVSKEALRARLKREGYPTITEMAEEPNTQVPKHHHSGDLLLFVLEGEMTVTMKGRTIRLAPGDELFFPAGVEHSAVMGPAGCRYIDGEKTQ